MYYNYNDYMNLSKTDKILLLKDVRGQYRTKSLFYEFRLPDYPYLFTLKDYDLTIDDSDSSSGSSIVPSLRQIYIDLNDPTEAMIATQIFPVWEHWDSMTRLVWFKDLVQTWREELEIKVRADALLQLRLQSQTSTSAAQFLAKGSWKDTKGRPTKAEKERQLKRETLISDEVDELYNRAIMN